MDNQRDAEGWGIDYNDPLQIEAHNECLRRYLVDKGILKRNADRTYIYVPDPLYQTDEGWVRQCKNLIGSTVIWGDAFAYYHEDNFQGMIRAAKDLDWPSPIISYICGNQRMYPPPLNCQLLGCGPVDNSTVTREDIDRIVLLGQEMFFTGTARASPSRGMSRPSEYSAYYYAACSQNLVINVANMGDVDCQYFLGGGHSISQHYTSISRAGALTVNCL